MQVAHLPPLCQRGTSGEPGYDRGRFFDMGWLDRRPQDATTQLLEYADSGRLIEVAAPKGNGSALALVIGAAITIGIGAGVVAVGILGDSGQAALLLGVVLLVAGLGVIAPAVRLLRETTTTGGVPIRPGAVLPPDLVRRGNWIFRNGAWLRVQHVGRDGGGRIHALLGSGDVVELRTPVTVAGDHFRPAEDPIESLRP